MKRLQRIWVRRLIWNHMCKTQAALVFSSFVHNSIRGRDCSSVCLSVHPFPVLSFSLSERVTCKLQAKSESERACERLRKRMRERAQFRQKRMKWIIRCIARANDIQKPYAIYFSRSYGERDGWKAINPTLVQKSWTIGCKSTHLLCLFVPNVMSCHESNEIGWCHWPVHRTSGCKVMFYAFCWHIFDVFVYPHERGCWSVSVWRRVMRNMLLALTV